MSNPVQIRALTKYLRDKSWSQRPPVASARVLAYMVELWENRVPFPTRQAVAHRLGVSVPTIDLVLKRHRTARDIRIVYEGGAPVVRGKRWVVPAPEIIALASASVHGERKQQQEEYRDKPQRRNISHAALR